MWPVITRVGNAASWYIFSWIPHHPAAYGVFSQLPVPKVVRPIWSVLYSSGHLVSVEQHTVHPYNSFVTSHDLPALAAELRAAEGQ
ncbi:MAG: hypothetical protein ACJAZO_005222 [Myxococcota bacterium]|jgi:hypothetical protein